MAGTDTRQRDSRDHLSPRGSVCGAPYRWQRKEGTLLLQALQHKGCFRRTTRTDDIGGHRRSGLGWESEPACRAGRGLSARTLYCEKCWTNQVASLGRPRLCYVDGDMTANRLDMRRYKRHLTRLL